MKLPTTLRFLQRLANSSRTTGLFGNPALTSPSAFEAEAKVATEQAYDLVESVVANKTPEKRLTVALVDDLSNCICLAADLTECVRNSHPSTAFAQAANDSMRHYTNLVETLNTNVDLFAALKASAETEKHLLDDVDRRTLDLLISDFEQSGVHLPASERSKFVDLSNEIFDAATEFVTNTDRPAEVPADVQQRYGLPPRIDSPFCRSSDQVFRETIFRLYYQPIESQEHHLSRLIGARHELAKLTGFGSFADRSQAFTMLGSYQSAKTFLEAIVKTFQPSSSYELELVRQTLKENKAITGDKVNEWDLTYGSALFRQQVFGDSLDLTRYFHFESLLSGFENLANILYGVNFKVSLPVTGELWDGNVVRVDVTKKNEFLGTIYIDVDDRPSKITGNCHYTVRCNKQLADGSHQHPIVLISISATSQTPPDIGNVCLSLPTAETFFHEMGHAMHSVLGRTRYQHTAGTRCQTDMSEVPSNVMEFFFRDPRVLTEVCKDASGRSIPKDSAEALAAANSVLSGVETLQQAGYALYDLESHGPEFAPALAAGKLTSTELYRLIGTRATPELGRNGDCAWPHRFSHTGPYGAKYYSYLVAKAGASLVWNRFFRKNPFDSEAGALWEKVQSYGGELPSADCLALALGKPPTADDLAKALYDHYLDGMKRLSEE